MGTRKLERKPVPGQPDNPAELPGSSYDGNSDSKTVAVPAGRPPIPGPETNWAAVEERERAQAQGYGGQSQGQEQDGESPYPEFAHLARASSQNQQQQERQQVEYAQAQQQHHANQAGQTLAPPSLPASLAISTPSPMKNTPTGSSVSSAPSTNPWVESLHNNSGGIMHAPPEQRYTPDDQVESEEQRDRRWDREQSADSGNDAWAFEAVERPAPLRMSLDKKGDADASPEIPDKGVSDVPANRPPIPAGYGEGADSPAWSAVGETPPLPRRSSERLRVDGGEGGNRTTAPAQPLNQEGEENAWVDLVRQDSWNSDQHREEVRAGKQPASAVLDSAAEEMRDDNGWESLAGPSQTQESQMGQQMSGVVTEDGEERLVDVPVAKPELPPRPVEPVQSDLIDNWAPAMPPRPTDQEQGHGQEASSSGFGGNEESTGSVVHHAPNQTQGQQQQERERKKEVYNIKTISVTLNGTTRELPILTQNANGPCPLVALVNAIILSTPEHENNEVMSYLRGKENISLGLLLEALINELYSPRYFQEGSDMADPSDLHHFLEGLSTGLNVNPLFIPASPPAADLLTGDNPAEPQEEEMVRQKAGTFAKTRELDLYTAFRIPLLHGWLPAPSSPAYAAFQRRARSHEDAQLMLLQQETLEGKLGSDQPLSEEEADVLQDISVISRFLGENGTQLTSYGLAALQGALGRGEVGILFRNDHFSTILRHPSKNGIFVLVSDEGFASEGDVVWESLTDVSGTGTELFTGGFERVSGGGGGGSPVHSRRPSQFDSDGQGGDMDRTAAEAMSHSDRERQEQEDADLAFAMRLEEEENARREREEIAERRAREDRLSAAAVQNMNSPQAGRGQPQAGRGRGNPPGRASGIPPPVGQGGTRYAIRSMLDVSSSSPSGPSIPARRGSGYQSVSSPAINIPPTTSRPADPEAGEENPPPSYEQAANEPAYVPTPANESRRASIRNSFNLGRRGASGQGGPPGGGGAGGRQVSGASFGGVPLSPTGALATPYGRDPTPAEIERERARRRARGEDDRDCVVM